MGMSLFMIRGSNLNCHKIIATLTLFLICQTDNCPLITVSHYSFVLGSVVITSSWAAQLLSVPRRDSRSHLHRDPWDTYPPASVVHVGIPEVWQLQFLLVKRIHHLHTAVYANAQVYVSGY